jgi:hypothetical protein
MVENLAMLYFDTGHSPLSETNLQLVRVFNFFPGKWPFFFWNDGLCL